MNQVKSVVVIGGGIVGLATAWKLVSRYSGVEVTVLDKEDGVGKHQSTHNSGVLHAGLYYKPGSLKARLSVSGIREMVEFAQEHGIAHEVCGKLVVATDERERELLHNLHERGKANGLQGLELLERGAMREIEPHLEGVEALRVPEEGIIDYDAVCRKLQELIEGKGSRVVTGAKVTSCRRDGGQWIAHSTKGDFKGDLLLNCAGLHCDRVARSAGMRCETKIIPFRGEYFKLKKEAEHLCRHLIYPVADPKFPFLGVHFTRLIHGGVECGPNAVLAFAREGYSLWDVNIGDLAESVLFVGLWRFMLKHAGVSANELRTSLSKNYFCKCLRKLIPEISLKDLDQGGAGVRAQAMKPDGTLVSDFDLIESEDSLHVLNAPSPAATASLAIGDELLNRIETIRQ